MTELAAHPVADLFPMLASDELAELAEDIKQRGQLHPIVLDIEGRILDGRNRHAACLLAEVEPQFVYYEGDDEAGYALAVNIVRRNLTTGARAVIAARAARLNGHSVKEAAERTDLFRQRITDANTVLDWEPALADAIVAGVEPLSTAVGKARERKAEAAQLAAKTARLHEMAPDLAALVGEGGLAIDDAIAALDAREETARLKAETQASEQERQRATAQQERIDWLGRARDRIRAVTGGWGTIRTILAEPDGADATEIITGLGDADRRALEEILQQIGQGT